MICTLFRRPNRISHLYYQLQQCRNVFGLKEILKPQETPDNFILSQITREDHNVALDLLKKYYIPEHVLVRSRTADIYNDQALDEYIFGLFRQGNSLLARTEDDSVAGVCVNFASSPVDPRNLRHYAFYRQDPNTKDLLYFTAKMQETPNLWQIFKQKKVFEMKMITVAPEFRRLGLAVLMAERSKELAYDQGYNIIRMDCTNSHDYKIAERCMLECIVKFPLHKLRGQNAPFIKRSSEQNCLVRVYVTTRAHESEMSDLELLLD